MQPDARLYGFGESAPPLEVRPITLREATAFVRDHHRHSKPPQGHRFSLGVFQGDTLVGVGIVGRPVARMLDDGRTFEVLRCCTDGTRNACSMIYGAARKAAVALGYRRGITYTLADELGSSLKASGWVKTAVVKAEPWGRPSRARTTDHEITRRARWEWEAA